MSTGLSRRQFIGLPFALWGDKYEIRRLTHDVDELKRQLQEVEMKLHRQSGVIEILIKKNGALIEANNGNVEILVGLVSRVSALEKVVLDTYEDIPA